MTISLSVHAATSLKAPIIIDTTIVAFLELQITVKAFVFASIKAEFIITLFAALEAQSIIKTVLFASLERFK